MHHPSITFSVLLLTACSTGVRADSGELRPRALAGLRSATAFFRQEVSIEGGYLWRYSKDLGQREGERRASATMAWVQPPGTPTVGMAFLTAYRATDDTYYLDAAKETAGALVNGQLRSGGWDYRIEFDPKHRARYAYRVDPSDEQGRNTTTLDDNTTQSALRFLMRVDRELDFEDSRIHEAADYALGSLLKAQYSNGAWPQRYSRFPESGQHFPKRASYPETWSRKFPNVKYQAYFTFNDNALGDMVSTMLEAWDIYADRRYKDAAEKAGEFILSAQMPEPQPGWAQQYDSQMHPAWARRFEPPAITGSESRDVLRTLLLLYRYTGEKKYLQPIPQALDYYRHNRLPDGSLARFYELRTHRALYFTKEYELTYSDDDMPTHYAFKVGDWTESISREYEKMKRLVISPPKPSRRDWADRIRSERSSSKKPDKSLVHVWKDVGSSLTKAKIEKILGALDSQGRWVEKGSLRNQEPGDSTEKIISCATFVRNVETISRYLAETRP